MRDYAPALLVHRHNYGTLWDEAVLGDLIVFNIAHRMMPLIRRLLPFSVFEFISLYADDCIPFRPADHGSVKFEPGNDLIPFRGNDIGQWKIDANNRNGLFKTRYFEG